MNLLKALAEFLTTDTTLASLLSGRVYRDRVSTDTATPFAIYTRESATHSLRQFENVQGVRRTTLTIEIVGTYEEQDTLDTIRQTIIEKIGGYVGALSTDWQGQIETLTEKDYFDANTGRSVRQLTILCREVFA